MDHLEPLAQRCLPGHASSDEGHSSKSALAPKYNVPAPVPNEPKWWCVDGWYQVYKNAKLLNDKGAMNKLVAVERKILTGSVHTVPIVHDLFTRHRLE